MDDVPVDQVVKTEQAFYDYLDTHHSDVLKDIAEKKELDENVQDRLKNACAAFKKRHAED